jgi:hypothetical protein|eukprot:COSAG02_NODE_10405_length_1948_cov_1.746890_3_plen_180_part_00
MLQAMPDLEQRAAAGVENLIDRRSSGSGAADDYHRSQQQQHELDNKDMLFLQLHAAQLDVLAPTHRGGFAGLYSAASRGRFTADCDPASACHCTDMHQVITKEIAARFEQEHYVILQNVLTPAEVNAANAEVNKLLANGTMRPNPQEEKWKNKRDGAPRRNSQNPHDDIAARDKGGEPR